MIDADEHSRVKDATLRNLVSQKKDSSVPWCFKDSGRQRIWVCGAEDTSFLSTRVAIFPISRLFFGRNFSTPCNDLRCFMEKLWLDLADFVKHNEV
jgi:hypothetical protein